MARGNFKLKNLLLLLRKMLSKNSKSESTNHHHVRQIQEQNQNSEHPGISSVEIQQPSGRILLEIRGICWKVAIS